MVLIYLSTIATSRRLLNPTGDDDCSWDVNAYDDGPTADREAGIGVEFESKGCSQEHTDQAKGKLVDDREGKDRKLTADTTLEAKGRLDAEYILDGTKIKLDNGRAGAAAAELAADLVRTSRGPISPLSSAVVIALLSVYLRALSFLLLLQSLPIVYRPLSIPTIIQSH